MAVGAITLAATAVFATKANKRFSPGFVSAKVGSNSYYVLAPNSYFTTKGESNHRVFVSISTVGGHKNFGGLLPLERSDGAQVFLTNTAL
jgi:hypothetical protein